MPKQLRIPDIQSLYASSQKIAMLTAYDYTFARHVDEAGADIILVGDSLGMVIQGHESTLPVTLEELIYHSKLVVRGTSRAVVVGDMPFLSYQPSPADAVRSAGRLVKEGGVHAVKLEGGRAFVSHIRAIIESGIPVMGHVGLMSQHVNRIGGFRVQGRSEQDADGIKADSLALQEAGCFAVLLEAVPAQLSEEITKSLAIPTIGIGAGPSCSGQVLVIHDLLGLTIYPESHKPKFVRAYSDMGQRMKQAVEHYVRDVKNGEFPSKDESYQ